MHLTEPAHNADIERLQLLFRQARATSIVASLAAAACALIIVSTVPAAGLGPWIWLSAIVAITVFRLALYRRFFRTRPGAVAVETWLRIHALAAIPVGVAAGSLPLLELHTAPLFIQELQILVPALVAMAALTSFGVYFQQYLVLLLAITVTTVSTRIWADGAEGIPTLVMFGLFAPILALTAHRYAKSIASTLAAKHRSEQLVQELTATNNQLQFHNATMARQQDLIEQEEALAKHVFSQLTLGGDHKLPGIHAWNQPMGSLSGDLTQTARGPAGQMYVFLSDFTGHGLPAALGALPASSVFLAMAAKGLPVETIAVELNRKLHELLPVGYFCCAVLLELTADRRSVHIWNGGLPPVMILRASTHDYEKIASHSVPLGVLESEQFESAAQTRRLQPGDVLYAFSDGLTEAENIDGEMWGIERLETFLQRRDLSAPKLPALIDAVLEHVNLAPPSDDISVVEVEATPAADAEANAA